MPRSTSPTDRLTDRLAVHRDDDKEMAWSTASSTIIGDNDYSNEYTFDDFEAMSKLSSHQQPWNHRLAGWARSRPRNLRRVFRRHTTHPILAFLRCVFIIVCALLLGTPIFAPSYTKPPKHYYHLASRCSGPTPEAGCANPFDEKVFISVSLYDATGQVVDGSWGRSLLRLIHMIGANNTFLSVYENDSGELGTTALDRLISKLGCRHKIVSDAHVSLSDFPTVQLPDGTERVKRLSYLSEMRNRALRPIDTYDPEAGVVQYDKVLFLNDVAFRPMDAAQLLFSTNAGPDGRSRYLSACGLDYSNPFLFYDLYAQRDAEGYSNGLPIFPIFSKAGQGMSRAAMLAHSDAVPVKSCWSGIVAMQAQYIQNMRTALPSPDFQQLGSHVIDPDSPKSVTTPVRFRYEPEVFVDACECCLFLADVSQAARRSSANELGTYVNPYVRVAYSERVLGILPWVKRWERLLSLPQAILTHVLALPTHNPHRAVQEGQAFTEEIWVNDAHGGHWELTPRKARNGMFCAVREMQVVQQGNRTNDINWENSKIPSGQSVYFPT